MLTPLGSKRQSDPSPLPTVLSQLDKLHFKKTKATPVSEPIQDQFPSTSDSSIVTGQLGDKRSSKSLKVGVVFSGGQAAGGHNVIAGLLDGLHKLNGKSQLFGFLDGPSGIIDGKYKELTKSILDPYRNQGGFDLIGSGRTKIETDEQLQASVATCKKLQLDGLVIVGGDDSNTNGAILAEFFLQNGCNTHVIGVPKTIDGDLKNEQVAISFGFDTACKTFSELIGNIARDALSAKKYTHFIKLMGRSASHITLECALATHPNLALIGEERQTLAQVTATICDLIVKRAEKKKNYGVILVPEGLIEFMPEFAQLISELNKGTTPDKLTAPSATCFSSLPEKIQSQLLSDRDPHGNVNVSIIETEQLLIEMAKKELKRRGFKGPFSPLHHFFGYEGRAGFPSHFDANYCFALGHVAAALIDQGYTSIMAFVGNLKGSIAQWSVGGLPLTSLLHFEERKGKKKPVIQKALVDLKGKAYLQFKKQSEGWALNDNYQSPGPIQFYGDSALTESVPAII
jgi:diphosphate-dependent phosphofructokinase